MKSFKSKLRLKKNITSASNYVTVMASKGIGRVWSFNINFWLLLGIVVAFVLYFLFSFIPLAQYFGEYHQENLLVQLEKDLQETQRALYQAKQRLKFLENYIDPSKIPAEIPEGTTNSKFLPGENGIAITRNSEIPAASGSGTQKPIVSIKGLKINRRGANLSVTFNLTRSGPGRSSIRGYLFIIAVDRSTNPPRFWPSSKTDFKNGTPVNFKKGRSYKIRNFRRIRARWSFKSAEKTPSEIRILAYDRAGSLLLKEDFHLEKDQNR
ncbi:MAG: hypothetical protein B6240_03120 [Desulfobacteraceae bacterium 4572_87]|nr:MAG: hypothetical protein B6240_03120 [Desulfobacteraceae bacterium 4572_87]